MSERGRKDAVLIGEHRTGCHAVEATRRGDWTTPWVGIPERTEWRAADFSRRGSSHPWLILRCNDTLCPALKAVRERAIAEIGDAPVPSEPGESRPSPTEGREP